jgi:hypothetical protein
MMNRASRVSWSILAGLASGVLCLTGGCGAYASEQVGTFARDLVLSAVAALAL